MGRKCRVGEDNGYGWDTMDTGAGEKGEVE